MWNQTAITHSCPSIFKETAKHKENSAGRKTNVFERFLDLLILLKLLICRIFFL